MNIKGTVGIARGFSHEQRQRLFTQVIKRLPNQQVYAGHAYVTYFDFDDKGVVMTKCVDGTVELALTCDGSDCFYPLN